MHEEMKEAVGIDVANCETCIHRQNCSDGDYGEYKWFECGKNGQRHYSYLNTFPFKKEMKCWEPSFWSSKFFNDEVFEGSNEFAIAVQKFKEAVAAVKELKINIDTTKRSKSVSTPNCGGCKHLNCSGYAYWCGHYDYTCTNGGNPRQEGCYE